MRKPLAISDKIRLGWGKINSESIRDKNVQFQLSLTETEHFYLVADSVFNCVKIRFLSYPQVKIYTSILDKLEVPGYKLTRDEN